MKSKIVVVLFCTLLIATSIPVFGKNIDISILKNDDDKINPLSSGDKWMVTYGGNKFDFGSQAIETSDGGYITVGTTSSFGPGEEDVWLLKTDYKGRLEWEKYYGGEYDEFGNSIKQTADGGYIITGSTESYGNGRDDVWLIKTDELGEMVWDKTFGGTYFDHGSEVLVLDDGYVIVGGADLTGGPRGDVLLLKTDFNGDLVWEKKFGGFGHNYGGSIDFTSDGGFIIVGTSYISDDTNYDFWLIKTDENGNLLWDEKFDNDAAEFGSDIQETSDDGFIIVGTSWYDNNNAHIVLIKTDEDGSLEWKQVFSEFSLNQRGSSVAETADGGYIIAGYTYFDSIFSFNGLIIKTDNLGVEEWSHHLTNFGDDLFFSVEVTIDEGYIFTGYKKGGINPDLWLVKADSNGNIPTCRNKNLFVYRLFNLFPNLYKIIQKILGQYL